MEICRDKINLIGYISTFPPCISLIKGYCLELYPYCLFHGLFSQGSVKGEVCVYACSVAPETIPLTEKSRLKINTSQRLRFKQRNEIHYRIPVAAKYRGKGLFFVSRYLVLGREGHLIIKKVKL